jgi:hypothetical protein
MADGQPDDQGEPDDVDQLLLAQTELHDAISQVLNQRGLMPTKWMLGVEGLDENGERVLETFTSPDFRAWDSIGILGFLDARERGSVGADAADDMRGDESA